MDSSAQSPIKQSNVPHLPQNTIVASRRNDNLLITTEVWKDVKEPWVFNGVTIAASGYFWVKKWDKGKHYAIRKTLNENAQLIGVYVDICSAVAVENDIFSYTDWYLDVWMDTMHNMSPVTVDQDQFIKAMGENVLSAEEAGIAKSTADIIMKVLTQSDFLNF